jgi:large subunit ribosomal protein L14
MIQTETVVKITDNAGGKVGKVFKILGGSRRRYARIGDVVILSVKIAEPRKGVKKKDVHRAVVVRQTQAFRRKDGSYIRFDDNAVVIIDKDAKAKKDSKELSEDDVKRIEKEIDHSVSDFQKEIESLTKAKEQDILTI